jgi:hypothetical protein
MSRREDELYVLTLPAEQHDVPGIIRLRAVLKRLLRDHGFRCTPCRDSEACRSWGSGLSHAG